MDIDVVLKKFHQRGFEHYYLGSDYFLFEKENEVSLPTKILSGRYTLFGCYLEDVETRLYCDCDTLYFIADRYPDKVVNAFFSCSYRCKIKRTKIYDLKNLDIASTKSLFSKFEKIYFYDSMFDIPTDGCTKNLKKLKIFGTTSFTLEKWIEILDVSPSLKICGISNISSEDLNCLITFYPNISFSKLKE